MKPRPVAPRQRDRVLRIMHFIQFPFEDGNLLVIISPPLYVSESVRRTASVLPEMGSQHLATTRATHVRSIVGSNNGFFIFL
jgi:hypothetical protein